MSKIPKLRFPEFTGEWEEKKLGEITSLMQSGLSRKLSDKDIGVPVIRSNNLINGRVDISDIRYWYEVDPQGSNLTNYFLKSGDLLVNFINSLTQIGKSAIYNNELKRKSIFTTNIMRLNFKKEINENYMFNYFQLKKYKNYIESITKPAVNQASFTTVDFKKFRMYIPRLQEQQKIASFFSTLDKKIEKQQEKVQALEKYKKGMIQKIFNHEIRFKDENGEDYPAWVEKKLGEVVITISSGKTKVKKEVGTYKVYGSIGIIGFTDNPDYCGKNILIARVGANAGVVNFVNEKCGISDNTLVVRYKSGIYPEFLYFQLKKYNLNRLIFGSGQPLITGSQLKKSIMKFPCLPEQQKIATFFSTLDKKIQKQQEKLDKLNEFKKGLLQQMFV